MPEEKPKYYKEINAANQTHVGCRFLYIVILGLQLAVLLLFKVLFDPLASWSWRHTVPSTCPRCLSRTSHTFHIRNTNRSGSRERVWVLKCVMFMNSFNCFIRPHLWGLQNISCVDVLGCIFRGQRSRR